MTRCLFVPPPLQNSLGFLSSKGLCCAARSIQVLETVHIVSLSVAAGFKNLLLLCLNNGDYKLQKYPPLTSLMQEETHELQCLQQGTWALMQSP